MAKTSPLTGTGKKSQRSVQKDVVHGEKHRRESNKDISKFRKGEKYHEETRRHLEQYKHHEKQFVTKEKNPFKEEEKFLRKGSVYKGSDYTKSLKKEFGAKGNVYKGKDQTDRLKQFEANSKMYKEANFAKSTREGTKLAEKALAPIQEKAIKDYEKYTEPAVAGQFAGGSSNSSAMQQALAASRESLALGLHAQTSELAARYGSDIAHTNLQENARQQQMQYGASSDITQLRMQENARKQQLQYGSEATRAQLRMQERQGQQSMQQSAAQNLFNQKYGANVGYANQRRSTQEYLNNLGLQSSSALQGAGLGGLGGALQSSYIQKAAPNGPSMGATIVGGVLKAAGTIGGAMIGGPAGAMAGYAGASAVSGAATGT